MQTNYESSDCPVPDFPGLFSADEVGSASLDTQETSEQIASESSYRHFLTSGCRKKVAFNRRILAALDDDAAHNRLLAYDGCRSSAYFVRHKSSGIIRVAASRCGLRWCPLCIKTKRYIIQQAVGSWIRGIKQPKFLTLTLKHTESPLSNQIDAIYAAWKELRRHKWFKKRVKGGIWFFQVKKSKVDNLWHPHIHILFEGRFLEHAQIVQIWERITHGSRIVDIRAVKDSKKAADYVARYAAAPCELDELDHDRAVDVVKSLHNRRICGSFGSGRAIKLTPKTPEDAKEWVHIGSFSSVTNMAPFDDNMAEVVRCWKSGDKCNYIPPDVIPGDTLPDLTLKAEPEPFRQPEFIFCK